MTGTGRKPGRGNWVKKWWLLVLPTGDSMSVCLSSRVHIKSYLDACDAIERLSCPLGIPFVRGEVGYSFRLPLF